MLASRQVHTGQDVSRLLGVHRNTRSRWLALHATGGVETLLATYIPADRPVSLAPAVLRQLGAGTAPSRRLCLA